MNSSLLLNAVYLRLTRFKMKSFFMALGVMVSVLATVLLYTAAGSVKETFLAFIDKTYPADGIVLVAGSGFMGGGEGRESLELTDVETVVHSIGGIIDWDPIVNARGRDVKYEGSNVRVRVVGHSDRAEAVRRRSVQDGEFFTPDEIARRENVALIGSTTAQRLFGGDSPLGARLFIDNVAFEVKGVLETIGVDPHGNDQDHAIWLPYTTLMDNILKIDYVSGVTFLAEEPSRVAELDEEITSIMREQHQIAEGQNDDFSVLTSDMLYDFFNRSFRTVSLFVPLIVGTAFLVSAFIILSIMQVTIKERTPEIGLRKAMGARARDVETQILLEVLILSVVACLVGVGLAYLGSLGLAPVLEEKMGVQQLDPSPRMIALAALAAVATGFLGAILPARRAARLDPVKALK